MWSRLRSWAPSLVPWALMLVGWGFLFGPTLARQVSRAFRPHLMNDDVRIQLYYFAAFRDPDLFTNDLVGRYHSGGTGELFRALYFLLVQGFDVLFASKLVTYATLSATLAAVGLAAHRLAGKSAAFIAVALVLSSELFIARMAGGLPRAFAFPLLGFALAALAFGRMRTVAVLAVVGAGFYPVVPVVVGLSLAIVLLGLPAVDRGSAASWSLRRRLVVLALTAAGAGAVMAPFALRMQAHGELITVHNAKKFPEAGPGGRVAREDRPPAAPYPRLAAGAARSALFGAGQPLIEGLGKPLRHKKGLRGGLATGVALLTALGVAVLGLRREGDGFRRVAAFAAGAALAFALAEPVSPRLVLGQRYVTYPIPLLVVVLVPVAALGLVPRRLLQRFRRADWARSAWSLGYGLLVLALFAGRGDEVGGINAAIKDRDRALFSGVARLPKNALVAGWPDGTLDTLPVAAARPALITYETYMPYHTDMTLEMRARMRAVINACFATNKKPLERLRREFGVTHLVVRKGFWRRSAGALFRPHARTVSKKLEKYDRRRASAFWDSLSHAVVFRDKRYRVIALDRI